MTARPPFCDPSRGADLPVDGVLDALQDGPAALGDLARRVGEPRSVVRALLDRAVLEGRASGPEGVRASYALTAWGRRCLQAQHRLQAAVVAAAFEGRISLEEMTEVLDLRPAALAL